MAIPKHITQLSVSVIASSVYQYIPIGLEWIVLTFLQSLCIPSVMLRADLYIDILMSDTMLSISLLVFLSMIIPY